MRFFANLRFSEIIFHGFGYSTHRTGTALSAHREDDFLFRETEFRL